MSKLWQKDYELNKLIEEFTVGNDYLIDKEIAASDCLASIAHGMMLNSIGVLSDIEIKNLKTELAAILEDSMAGNFEIKPSDEDCHTAIENRLTERVGEAGKKIHTGRSRNDQVITAVRLYSRAFILQLIQDSLGFADVVFDFANRHSNIPMPGRTHMQTGMPSSVGLWAAAYGEEILDQTVQLRHLFELIDCSPLGSAASYGTPLPLDREMTASLMGFSRVQNNVLYANNSRGKFESMILDACDNIVLTLTKAAQDLILFSLPEFGYFSLPRDLCSGSSIMPQKKNPDGLELLRAKSGTISSCSAAIKNIIRSLPSGYNRDFQETKEPFIRASRLTIQCVRIMQLTFEKLEVNEKRLVDAFTPDIFATDAAFELVAGGMSFRDAYKEVGLNLDKLSGRDPYQTIGNRKSTGTAGNLRLDVSLKIIESEKKKLVEKSTFLNSCYKELCGLDVKLF